VWSPFVLQADLARPRPGSEKAPAEAWSPLAGSEPQWRDAASRVRRAGIVFACLLIASTMTLAGSLVLFLWGSEHHNDYTPSTLVFSTGLLGLVWTYAVWDRRKKLRQVGKAAAGLADSADGSASPLNDRGEGRMARRPGGLEIAAKILLPVGGFLLLVGWLAGCVLLWVSPRWRWTDKLLGTLVCRLASSLPWQSARHGRTWTT
jgi:hypothetical protein